MDRACKHGYTNICKACDNEADARAEAVRQHYAAPEMTLDEARMMGNRARAKHFSFGFQFTYGNLPYMPPEVAAERAAVSAACLKREERERAENEAERLRNEAARHALSNYFEHQCDPRYRSLHKGIPGCTRIGLRAWVDRYWPDDIRAGALEAIDLT
jgi:hypothetical protein